MNKKKELKTLKDIEKDYDDELAIYIDGKGEMPPMLEVKCSKCGNTSSFEWDGDEDFIKYYHRKMKEVAMEWIKYFDGFNIKKVMENPKKAAYEFDKYYRAKDWIKHFFNLEDEK